MTTPAAHRHDMNMMHSRLVVVKRRRTQGVPHKTSHSISLYSYVEYRPQVTNNLKAPHFGQRSPLTAATFFGLETLSKKVFL